MASFYLSDEKWTKGEEFTLFDMNDGDSNEQIKTMSNIVTGEILSGVGDRLIYVFDFMNIWKFFFSFIIVSTT